VRKLSVGGGGGVRGRQQEKKVTDKKSSGDHLFEPVVLSGSEMAVSHREGGKNEEKK